MIGDSDDGWMGTSRDAGTEFVASGQDSLGADGTRDLFVIGPPSRQARPCASPSPPT
jgi:hypothetical protein